MKNYCCTLQVLPSLFIEGEKEGIILENTKWKRTLKLLCVISAIAMVALPWFSFNPKVTGYYWGMDSLLYAWVPLIIIALYLFQWKTNKIGSILLAEAALFSLLGIYVYAFLYWPCSITGDAPNMGVSLSAALPTFWIGFAVMLCTLMAFQAYFIRQCVRK